MKAASIKEYGGGIEVSDMPQPELLADSVLIEVHAASVNPLDNVIRAGYMQQFLPITFPYILGSDLSGTIIGIGKEVTKFKNGDEVFSRPNSMQAGTIAEFAVIKESELTLKPAKITHLDAASIPLVSLTAWQALVVTGNLEKGQKVLIQAGSGGVGTMAIQIAKHLGAYVATTTSSDNFDLVKSLGADLVIDYKAEKFEDKLSGYDLVLDVLGGETLNNGFKVLKKGGIMVSLMGPDSEGLAAKYDVRFEQLASWPDGEMLSNIGKLISNGSLKPVVDRRFTIEETKAAFDYSQSGRAKGKIVIKIK